MRDTWTVRWTFGTQGVKYSVGFLGHKAEQCGEGRLRHRPLKSRLVVVSVGRSWVKGVILVFQNSTFGHHLGKASMEKKRFFRALPKSPKILN